MKYFLYDLLSFVVFAVVKGLKNEATSEKGIGFKFS